MNDPVITVVVPSDTPVPIWVSGDYHIGNDAHDSALLSTHIDRAEREGWRGIHLGDGPEQVGVTDKVAQAGGLNTQILPPIEQRRILAEKISRVKFDVLLPGNHDLRVDARVGISYVETVIDRANLVRAERGDTHRTQGIFRPGFVVYQVGDQAYTFFLHHGEGPTINTFALHTRIQARTEGVDVILAGHTHTLGISSVVSRGPGYERTIFWVRTGHYLSNPAYAAIRPINVEGQCGSCLLWLSPDEHKIRPELLVGG